MKVLVLCLVFKLLSDSKASCVADGVLQSHLYNLVHGMELVTLHAHSRVAIHDTSKSRK